MSDYPADPDDLRESRVRSVLKAITYRVTGTVTTAAITFFVTGEILTAFAVGVIEPVFKIAVYYLHERAWQQVPRGHVRRWMNWHERLRWHRQPRAPRAALAPLTAPAPDSTVAASVSERRGPSA